MAGQPDISSILAALGMYPLLQQLTAAALTPTQLSNNQTEYRNNHRASHLRQGTHLLVFPHNHQVRLRKGLPTSLSRRIPVVST